MSKLATLIKALLIVIVTSTATMASFQSIALAGKQPDIVQISDHLDMLDTFDEIEEDNEDDDDD